MKNKNMEEDPFEKELKKMFIQSIIATGSILVLTGLFVIAMMAAFSFIIKHFFTN